MKARVCITSVAVLILSIALASPALARQRKSKKPPKPANKEVKYDAYKGTDIAQLKYKTSRKEFRVGHSPYLPVRFYTAEFVLITEHAHKYERQDYKAEIKMVPGRTKPTLMANKNFQSRWKEMLTAQAKLVAAMKTMKAPKECATAQATFIQALEDELFLAQKVADRMFAGQDIRSRERLKEELTTRFRARNTEWFDRLSEDFEKTADLSKFFPRFIDLLVQPMFDKAAEQTKQAMGKVGLEYATAVEEEGDITAP